MAITVLYPALLLLGLALLGFAGYRVWQRFSRREWQETEAEVLYSDIRPLDGSEEGSYLGVCILSYDNAGTKLVGQFHFAKGLRYAAMQLAAKQFAAGSRQRILVRPDDPERVLLQSVNVTDVRLAAVCGVLGCVFTVAALTLLRSA